MDWLTKIERKLNVATHKSPTGQRITSGHTLPVQDAVKLIAAVKVAEETLDWYGLQMTYEYIKDESAPILYDRGRRALKALAQLQSGKFGGDSDANA